MLSKHVSGDDERRVLCELPSGMQILAIFLLLLISLPQEGKGLLKNGIIPQTQRLQQNSHVRTIVRIHRYPSTSSQRG